ncbi:MAG: hypothetical protein M3066_19695 [Actinomycetota bacterium]|nr:hypothetical protein [Actinomycetota bacterium]
MNKKIISIGVGAASIAALAFGAAGSASADGSITGAVCLQLPASVAGVTAQLAGAQAAANAAANDLGSPTVAGTKQYALGVATTNLANTVVAYIKAADRGDNLTATGQALTAAASVFGDRAVAENNAMTASFDAQRTLYVAALNSSFYGSIDKGLCTAPTTTTSTTSTTKVP